MGYSTCSRLLAVVVVVLGFQAKSAIAIGVSKKAKKGTNRAWADEENLEGSKSEGGQGVARKEGKMMGGNIHRNILDLHFCKETQKGTEPEIQRERENLFNNLRPSSVRSAHHLEPLELGTEQTSAWSEADTLATMAGQTALVPFPGTASYYAWEEQINELAKRKAWRRLEVIASHLRPALEALGCEQGLLQLAPVEAGAIAPGLAQLQSSFQAFRERAAVGGRDSSFAAGGGGRRRLLPSPVLPHPSPLRSSSASLRPPPSPHFRSFARAQERSMALLTASMRLEAEVANTAAFAEARRRLAVLCAHLFPWQLCSLLPAPTTPAAVDAVASRPIYVSHV